MLYQSILETIGNTPVVRLNHLEGHLAAGLWVKVESFNPCGSIKDRPALNMIEDAERAGREGDDGAFDANVALITGELRGLLPALLEALGGLAQPGTAAPAPEARPAEPADTSTPPWDVAPA